MTVCRSTLRNISHKVETSKIRNDSRCHSSVDLGQVSNQPFVLCTAYRHTSKVLLVPLEDTTVA